MLNEYLQKYVETFGENFPTFAFMGISDDEIIKTIQGCLTNDKPYQLEVKNNVYY